MRKVWLRIPEETLERIKHLADIRNEMISDTLRYLIENALDFEHIKKGFEYVRDCFNGKMQ